MSICASGALRLRETFFVFAHSEAPPAGWKWGWKQCHQLQLTAVGDPSSKGSDRDVPAFLASLLPDTHVKMSAGGAVFCVFANHTAVFVTHMKFHLVLSSCSYERGGSNRR